MSNSSNTVEIAKQLASKVFNIFTAMEIDFFEASPTEFYIPDNSDYETALQVLTVIKINHEEVEWA